MARRTASFSIFAAAVALLVGLWAPTALARHSDEHDHGKPDSADASDHDGDADSDPNTAYTEDNDTNDGGTPDDVSDDGDNAHPSGNDKSVENGGSGTQGKSESNPDDSKGPMRYEGQLGDDKPNGPGGTDLADQDGNNGCGNDDDFDDDNNGWCGKPTATATATEVEVEVEGSTIDLQPCDADLTMPGIQKCGEGLDVGADLETKPAGTTEVLGIRFSAAVQPAAVQAAAQPAAVQAAALSALPDVAGAVLPFTGSSNLMPFLTVALMLISAGALSLRGRRSES